MRKVWSHPRAGIGAADGVAHEASMGQEHSASTRRFGRGWVRGRLELLLFPRLKLIYWLGCHRESHMRVLKTAEFGTLAAINTGFIHFEPKGRRVAGQQIAFTIDTWSPKTVNHVGGVRENNDRRPNWNVDFVRCGYCLVRLRIW